jgi:hypothetical protein
MNARDKSQVGDSLFVSVNVCQHHNGFIDSAARQKLIWGTKTASDMIHHMHTSHV